MCSGDDEDPMAHMLARRRSKRKRRRSEHKHMRRQRERREDDAGPADKAQGSPPEPPCAQDHDRLSTSPGARSDSLASPKVRPGAEGPSVVASGVAPAAVQLSSRCVVSGRGPDATVLVRELLPALAAVHAVHWRM